MSDSTDKKSSASPELESLIDQYLQLSEEGTAVDVELLCAEAPHLADSLRSFIAMDATVGQIGETDVENKAGVTASPATTDTSPPTYAGLEIILPGSDEAADLVLQEEMFGRYKLIKLLGQGAMGSVYLAEDTSLQRQVALKIPKFAKEQQEEFMSRFLREARSAAAVSHPNICQVHDIGEENGTPYLTMAFIDGETLSEHIGSEQYQNEVLIVKLMISLSQALAKAHAQGIIHRDLKPGNVMLDAEGTPFITDFGLACKVEQTDDSRLTQEGTILGTPAYMSPEQIEGNAEKVGPQSDLYSLGVMFYELLTGELPFKGTIPMMLGQILRDPPKPPSELRKDVNKQLEKICLRMMEKSCEKRYASCADVAKELQTWLEMQPATRKSAAKNKQPASQKSLTDEKGKPTPASSGFDAFGGVKVAAIVGGVAFLLMLGAITLYLTGSSRTYKITVDDPDAKVIIDDKKVSITNGEGTVMLSLDKHEVTVVDKDGTTYNGWNKKVFSATKEDKKLLEIKVLDKSGKPLVAVRDSFKVTSKEFQPRSFQLYYGNEPAQFAKMLKQITAGQLVVIETRELSLSQMKQLLDKAKVTGAKVIGYLSIGEIDDGYVKNYERVIQKFRNADPKRYPSDFGQLDQFTINRNEEFQSARIDVINEAWRIFIDEEITRIYNTGVHGLFLDSIDTVDFYITHKKWPIDRRIISINKMQELIRNIKLRDPEKLIMQNRGLNIIGQKTFVGNETEIEISGMNLAVHKKGNPDFLLWEDAYSETDEWGLGKAKEIEQIQKAGFCKVFALGYSTGKISKPDFFKKSKAESYISAWASSSSSLHKEIASEF